MIRSLFKNASNGIKKYFVYAFGKNEYSQIFKADVLLFCRDADRGYYFSGKKYSQLIDSLNELFVKAGLSTITIANPYAKLYGDKAFGHVVNVNGLFARSGLNRLLVRSIKKKNIDNYPTTKVWAKIIKKVDPKVIIGIQPPIELCVAAKQQHSWIADLQHGILSNEHYYGMKYRNHVEQKGWPDCVLCWDENSAAWLRKELGGIVEAKVIGNPWFLRFMEPSLSDPIVLQEANKLENSLNQAPVILVSLQWGLETIGTNYRLGMSVALIEFIKKEGSGFTWWLRVHPVLLNSSGGNNFIKEVETEFAGCENVQWKKCSELPLPVILRNCHLHITSHSAITIEASWFGLKTGLLDDRVHLLKEYFGELLDSGLAEIVSPNIPAIGTWIENSLKNRNYGDRNTDMNSIRLNTFIHWVKAVN